MNTDYEKQAEQFLSDNDLKMRITLSNSKTAPWEPSGNHYRVTISHKADQPRESANASRRITFDFFGSVHDMEKNESPTAYDVLACIGSDIAAPETFDDFCANYGYEQDSIKVLQSFRRTDRFAKRLRAFFTPDEQEQLSEIQ